MFNRSYQKNNCIKHEVVVNVVVRNAVCFALLKKRG